MAKKFSVSVNAKWCKGCAVCVAVCPKHVLAMDDDVKCSVVAQDECVGCRQCDEICPDLAITVEEVDIHA